MLFVVIVLGVMATYWVVTRYRNLKIVSKVLEDLLVISDSSSLIIYRGKHNYEYFAEAIHDRGAPFNTCWGFIDGTVENCATKNNAEMHVQRAQTCAWVEVSECNCV